MYTYNASLSRVIDGDTVEMKIDLGFTVTVLQVLRLLGINAPEMKGTTKSAGQEAKKCLEGLLGAASSLVLRTEKPLKTDKYGRYLATITALNADDSVMYVVNDRMIELGQAVVYVP